LTVVYKGEAVSLNTTRFAGVFAVRVKLTQLS